MAASKTITCPSCGFKNAAPVVNNRCVSCGASIEEVGRRSLSPKEAIERRYQQEGFSPLWFVVSVGIMSVLTAAIVVGLPMVLPLVDFEGSAGMMAVIPVWCAGGLLVGLVSPGRTFVEPVVAAFLVAIPTAILLHSSQTVKVMPGFMYALLSAVGVLFTLVGSYLGERIQLGPPPKAAD